MSHPPRASLNTRSSGRHVTRLTGVILAITLTLSACTSPSQPTPADPYAGGVTHPWSTGTASPAGIPAKVNSISDLDYRSAKNGWGPIESNHSNGSEQADDGGTLSVGGQTFASGLGVHASSEITYTLPGTCTTFTAQVGVDDEVGARGSVVFQVYGDGVKLADSGVRVGGQAAVTVTATLKGVKELKLVVTDAGDGIAYDHADWGAATLDCTPVKPPPPTNTFTYSSIASQPDNVGVSEAQGEFVGGKLYVFGGFDSLKNCCTPTDRVNAYDPVTNTWAKKNVMPTHGVTHAGMTTDGQFIYFAGGYIANASWTGQIFGTDAAWKYDPQKDTYSALPKLPVTIAAGQLEYLNGTLHYFGGTNTARTQDLGVHYVLNLSNPAAGWTTAADMPHPRQHMGSVVLGGKIYAVGGQIHHDANLTTENYVEAYDPATDRWTEVAPLPLARSHIANSTFVLEGRIVVAGGESAHDQPIADVSAYDPATNTWTALTKLPVALISSVAVGYEHGFLYTDGNTGSKQVATGLRATPAP
ncbi:NPCBM/NEW2 domain-containing protein [Deinococcus sp. KSM4-11]|uniref:NPCBM/NEW2 domain-containing protein n=1 Tax=Deinococcus sp. KSM4-11 TaxID=2568654 RepID=UPI001F111E6B|nr:NPCBM/NEW2 domain-containing protein [Deinococcus sp. KSM4-11]